MYDGCTISSRVREWKNNSDTLEKQEAVLKIFHKKRKNHLIPIIHSPAYPAVGNSNVIARMTSCSSSINPTYLGIFPPYMTWAIRIA